MPFNWQHYYFFMVLPPLLLPIYFNIEQAYFLARRKMVKVKSILFLWFKFFLNFLSKLIYLNLGKPLGLVFFRSMVLNVCSDSWIYQHDRSLCARQVKWLILFFCKGKFKFLSFGIISDFWRAIGSCGPLKWVICLCKLTTTKTSPGSEDNF